MESERLGFKWQDSHFLSVLSKGRWCHLSEQAIGHHSAGCSLHNFSGCCSHRPQWKQHPLQLCATAAPCEPHSTIACGFDQRPRVLLMEADWQYCIYGACCIMVAVKYQYIFMVWACSGSHLHWAENFLYHQSQEGTLSPSSVPKPIIWLLMDWDWLLFTVECCAFIWVDSLGTENETGAALWSGNTTQPLCPVTLAWA